MSDEKRAPVRGRPVLLHGPDHNLTVDELDGIQLVEPATSVGA